MSRKLIFNADDYGLTPAVSKGILRAANGVVRSTTVMANIVTDAELRWLKTSSLKAGAHLNLTLGSPLTKSFPNNLLNHSGAFDKATGLRNKTWISPEAQSAVTAEWSAQIAKLQTSGLRLTHLDSHHHIHMLDSLFPIALRLAKHHDIGIRTRIKQVSIATNSGVKTPASLEENFFGEHKISRGVILHLLAEASADCVEVMCHPGLADSNLLSISSYRFERVAELQTLSNPALAGRLEKQGWKLCGYDEI